LIPYLGGAAILTLLTLDQLNQKPGS